MLSISRFSNNLHHTAICQALLSDRCLSTLSDAGIVADTASPLDGMHQQREEPLPIRRCSSITYKK